MITHPTAAELTAAVAAFLERIRADLPPRDAFLARVAANALAAVTRELEQGPAAEAAARDRLAALLDLDGDHARLTQALCEALRTGAMDATTPGLLATLRANTEAQLAIDQPGYKHGA